MTPSNVVLPLLWLIIILIIPFTNSSQSGIYIDNGKDQTIMQRILTDEDKLDVSYEILEFLGVTDRPLRRGINSLSLSKSAPKFLLDIYYRITAEEGLANKDKLDHNRSKRDTDENEENFITDLDKRAIDESDIIMTFLNKRNNYVEEMRHEHGQRLWFDITDIPNDNFLIMAELRIFQNAYEGKWLTTNKHFTVTVYLIQSGVSPLRKLEPLSSVNTTGDYVGWLELNVTEALQSWLANPKENHGIYVGAHAINKPNREIKLDDIGLTHPKIKVDDGNQPFMIGFFRGPELIKASSAHRPQRRIKRSSLHQRKRNKSDVANPFLDGLTENPRSCQMQTLYIDFKDLGWHDWIIAPEGYGAFYCSGECNFPLNAHMNATNHAIVQTLVHLLEPKKVPKPCCAPTRLGALPVLYHLNDENVNLKKYRNMIVKSCGCH